MGCVCLARDAMRPVDESGTEVVVDITQGKIRVGSKEPRSRVG